MATRRIRPLTAADLPDLPEPCVRCTFWEASLGDLATPADHRDPSRSKQEWAHAVTARWGHCGVMAVIDQKMVGYLTVAPAGYVPRLGSFPTTPVSGDAAVVVSARVAEEMRGRGIGRQLVQSAAALLVRRDIRALEVVGTTRQEPSCMLPASWLEAVGFSVVRPHPATPRLRMDLSATARWRTDLGSAWSRFTDLVVQPAAPEAAHARPAQREATPG